MPIVELVSAFGARLHSGDLFCFWIRYEAPTADRGSHGAPWLCQPNPASIVPKTVMPYQVSWQLVVMKSEGSMHVRGGAAVKSVGAGGALVGITSEAHASAVLEVPTTVRRNAAQIPSFAMRSSQQPEPRLTANLGLIGGCIASNIRQFV
jgi:hypothetical protein